VGLARSDSISLKVTLPLEIAERLSIDKGDFIEWSFERIDGKLKGIIEKTNAPVRSQRKRRKKKIVLENKPRVKVVEIPVVKNIDRVNEATDIERRLEAIRKKVFDANDKELLLDEVRKKAKKFEDNI